MDESRNHEDRVERAATLDKTAARCFKCDVPLEEGAEVWRVTTGLGWRGRWVWCLVPMCADCGATASSWRERTPPRPCEGGCGRRVVNTGGWAPAVVHPVCSQRCRKAAAALRRHHVRHEPRPCSVCVESFTPTRSDALYCGSACRQLAYRRRLREAEESAA